MFKTQGNVPVALHRIRSRFHPLLLPRANNNHAWKTEAARTSLVEVSPCHPNFLASRERSLFPVGRYMCAYFLFAFFTYPSLRQTSLHGVLRVSSYSRSDQRSLCRRRPVLGDCWRPTDWRRGLTRTRFHRQPTVLRSPCPPRSPASEPYGAEEIASR